MTSSTRMKRKRRWSLVRIFVSLVPELFWKYFLPKPIRICFNLNVNYFMPVVKCDVCQTGSPRNFNSFKSYLSHSNKALERNLNSTPKLEVSSNSSRISDLQKDLEKLKDQVAQIIRQQQERSEFSDQKNFNKGSSYCLPQPIVPKGQPTSLPPPPPPLPSHILTTKPSQGLSFKINEEKKKRTKPLPPVAGFPSGEELLRDLKKVQLKKIQKSPGGGPLKKEKHSQQDPGNFLEEVLKKRFSYIQNISSDTSPDSTVVDINNSFNTETYQTNIYEFCQKASTTAS